MAITVYLGKDIMSFLYEGASMCYVYKLICR